MISVPELNQKTKLLALEQLPSSIATQLAIDAITKDIQAHKQAKNWLNHREVRLNLAFALAKAVLENEALGVYSTVEEKRNDKKYFIYNLYECLTCLFESFRTGVDKEMGSKLRRKLLRHDLNFYVKALCILKHKAKEVFVNKEDITNLIDEYIENLIKKIVI